MKRIDNWLWYRGQMKPFLLTVLKSKNDVAEAGIPYHLPKTLVEMTVVQTKDNNDIVFNVTIKPVLAPDLKTQFILQHQESPMVTDRVCVSRSTTGLLQSVQIRYGRHDG